MTEEELEKIPFEFQCLVTELLGRGFKFDWEHPWTIDKIVNNNSLIKQLDETGVEYFLLFENLAVGNKKITQLRFGKVRGLYVKRTILVGTNVSLTDLENCIESSQRNDSP